MTVRSVKSKVGVLLGLALLVAGCSSSAPNTTPTGADEGFFLQGSPTAPNVVEVVEDPLCTGCATLYLELLPALQPRVEDGSVQVRTIPVAFASQESLEAANAWACAYDQDATSFETVLYRNQPPLGAPPTSTQAYIGMAEQSGVSDVAQFEKCLTTGQFNEWILTVTEEMRRLGVTRVPTIAVNGVPLPDDKYTADGIISTLP